jgi:hypothetical protein
MQRNSARLQGRSARGSEAALCRSAPDEQLDAEGTTMRLRWTAPSASAGTDKLVLPLGDPCLAIR